MIGPADAGAIVAELGIVLVRDAVPESEDVPEIESTAEPVTVGIAEEAEASEELY